MATSFIIEVEETLTAEQIENFIGELEEVAGKKDYYVNDCFLEGVSE